jgi:hypothetical protein
MPVTVFRHPWIWQSLGIVNETWHAYVATVKQWHARDK